MTRIFVVLLASLCFGGTLAWTWAVWPIAPGWIGAGLLVGLAGLAHWHWNRRQNEQGDEPGPYERLAWHSMVSMAVVSSHTAASLATGLDIHIGQGNSLATDNWTLVLGAAIGWIMMRPRAMQQDERDRQVAARGAHASFRVLVALLIGLLLTLGFAPVVVTETLTPFIIGNILVVFILLSALVGRVTQLLGYWSLARGEHVDG